MLVERDQIMESMNDIKPILSNLIIDRSSIVAMSNANQITEKEVVSPAKPFTDRKSLRTLTNP
jgi:hypothetical protein